MGTGNGEINACDHGEGISRGSGYSEGFAYSGEMGGRRGVGRKSAAGMGAGGIRERVLRAVGRGGNSVQGDWYLQQQGGIGDCVERSDNRHSMASICGRS